ncbi:hypothetical protein ACMHYC_10745 [Acinetobacter courvalinii]|uniref:hypothetical protein n=1 Tax=Acinetobacter courvalinii TaxID=280147 RepID=UPI0039C94CC0
MSDISIEEFKNRKEILEKQLAEKIAEMIGIFEKETGVNVHDVYVNFADVTAFGEEEKYVLTSVNVKTEISN